MSKRRTVDILEVSISRGIAGSTTVVSFSEQFEHNRWAHVKALRRPSGETLIEFSGPVRQKDAVRLINTSNRLFLLKSYQLKNLTGDRVNF